MSKIDEVSEEILNNVKRYQDDFLAWTRATAWAKPILTSLEDMPLRVYWDGDINLSFIGTGQDLARVWRVLRASGFDLGSGYDRPQKGQSTWSGRFDKGEDKKVYILFTSSLCRPVQVGTKIEEVPIYETHCDDPITQDEVQNDFL